MAGESDYLHDGRLFSGRRVHWLRWAYSHKPLTAYVLWHVTQARNKVCVSRNDWTEKLRLSVTITLISDSSVSIVAFGKGARSLSVGRFLGERVDKLSIGRRMCPCQIVLFDMGPKPSCFTRRLN